jgi:hypothetical protein
MRQQLVTIFVLLSAGGAFADDVPCLSKYEVIRSQFFFSACFSKYKVIRDQFDLYKEKSTALNAVKDRIAAYYTEGTPVQNVHPADAREWRAALEAFIEVVQPFLQNLMEFEARGCSPDQLSQQNALIEKAARDLKTARARLNALVSDLPASTFK